MGGGVGRFEAGAKLDGLAGAPVGDFGRDLAAHAGGGGARPARVGEDVRFGELELFGKLVGLLKVVVSFTREACNDIGADGYTWNEPLYFGDNLAIPCAIVTACHAA